MASTEQLRERRDALMCLLKEANTAHVRELAVEALVTLDAALHARVGSTERHPNHKPKLESVASRERASLDSKHDSEGG